MFPFFKFIAQFSPGIEFSSVCQFFPLQFIVLYVDVDNEDDGDIDYVGDGGGGGGKELT